MRNEAATLSDTAHVSAGLGEYVRWEHPLRKGGIHMASPTIGILAGRALHSLQAKPPSEIGGILWGERRVEASEPATVIVEAQIVPSIQPLYNSAGSDAPNLVRALSLGPKQAGLSPVGYFRSHVREGLSLSVEDQEFISQNMRDPDAVFLLIRPFEMGICMAAFFFWQDGQLQTYASDLEVPFMAADGKNPREWPLRNDQPERARSIPELGPPTPDLNRSTSIPKLHPNSSSNSLPERVTNSGVHRHTSAIPRPIEVPEGAAPLPTDVKRAPEIAATSEATVPVPESQPKNPFTMPQAPAPASEDAKRPEQPRLPGRKGRIRFWVYRAAIIGLVAGGTVAVLVWHRTSVAGTSLSSGAPAAKAGLDLHAEGQGDRILLTWNRHNSVAHTAAGANLYIDDGSQHRQVHFDLAQIAVGSVLYRPISDDVSFRLEIQGSNGQSTAESLRVLDNGKKSSKPIELSFENPAPVKDPVGGKSPHQQVSQSTGNGQRQMLSKPPARFIEELSDNSPMLTSSASSSHQKFDLSRLDAATPTVASQHIPEIPPEPAPKPAEDSESIPAARSNAVESTSSAEILAERGSPSDAFASERSSPSLTPVRGGTSPAQAVDPQRTSGASAAKSESAVAPLATAPPPKPITNQPPATATAMPNYAGRYMPPKPAHEVLPDLSIVPAALVLSAGQVNVTVTVDKTGHVTSAHVEPGENMPARPILSAAERAAQQWVFEPARLDGQPIPSQHSIVFQFSRR